MPEPEMYPLTDYPDYEEKFDTFEQLRAQVESTIEGLNHIVSWLLFRAGDRDLGDGEVPTFHLLLFMPRKSKTTEFLTANFDPDVVDAWLREYVKPRVLRWYGWPDADA